MPIFNKEDYLMLFNNSLDGEFAFNGGAIYAPHICADVSESDRLDILNEIALRAQVEFGKNVVLLTNKEVESEIEQVKDYPTLAERIKKYADNDTLFLCNFVCGNYNSGCFEAKAIDLLIYYKLPFYGFSVYQQRTYIYEG